MSMHGTIVPPDDVDTFAMEVGDGSQLLCDGRFTVTITAPAGMTLRLEVLDGEDLARRRPPAPTASPAASPSANPDCLFDDSPHPHGAGLPDRDRPQRSTTYLLERAGSF